MLGRALAVSEVLHGCPSQRCGVAPSWPATSCGVLGGCRRPARTSVARLGLLCATIIDHLVERVQLNLELFINHQKRTNDATDVAVVVLDKLIDYCIKVCRHRNVP